MKKSHLFILVIIAAAVGVIISTAGDASTYVSFKDANEMAADGVDSKVHVVGKLKKGASGQIVGMEYQPEVDPNMFKFVLVDNNNEEQTVVYRSPKPQDFDRSEQIVIIGNVQKDIFVADKILMKCPSKYEDKELKANI